MERLDEKQARIQQVLAKSDCLYDLATVEQALDGMADRMTEQLQDANPLILCVMIGGLIPIGRLLTRLHFPLEVDYIHVTRYQSTTRGGDLHWLVSPRQSLKNRTVVVFDDVMDGGLTLGAIIDYCNQAGAKKVYTAVLISKDRPREPTVNFEPDFIGLKTADRYIFGYGLDYHEYLRNAPGIYAIAKEHES